MFLLAENRYFVIIVFKMLKMKFKVKKIEAHSGKMMVFLWKNVY